MNKAQIKAELRRSACEDGNPYGQVKMFVIGDIVFWSDWPMKRMNFLDFDDQRTFFLLVAEAL